MVHSILFAMSLSGSVIVLGYLLTYRMAQRFFSPTWRYLILKAAMLFYLTPVCLLLHGIRSSMGLWAFPVAENFGRGEASRPVEILINGKEGIWLDAGARIRLAAVAVSGLIAMMLLLWRFLKYGRMKRFCLMHPYEAAEGWRVCFSAIKRELGIRERVRLLCSASCETPMVLGVLSPVVVLPLWGRTDQDAASMKYIVKHELVHVRSHDVQIRFLGLLACSLHWFNPLCLLMYNELIQMGEICCDDVVIRDEGEEGRRTYSYLLLRLAARAGEKKGFRPDSSG